MVVNEEAVATSRIPMAHVNASLESGVCVNFWFHYNDDLLEVSAVDRSTVTCIYVEQPDRQSI
jgi:hypothetical protein